MSLQCGKVAVNSIYTCTGGKDCPIALLKVFLLAFNGNVNITRSCVQTPVIASILVIDTAIVISLYCKSYDETWTTELGISCPVLASGDARQLLLRF